jgi:hypothetical protein
VEESYVEPVLQLPLEVVVEDAAAVNETAVRLQVALALGIPLEIVSFSLTAPGLRRLLSEALQFMITIADEGTIADEATALVLASVWSNKTLAQLSEALGMQVTAAPAPVVTTVVKLRTFTITQIVLMYCSPGYWGVNGKCVPVCCCPNSVAIYRQHTD